MQPALDHSRGNCGKTKSDQFLFLQRVNEDMEFVSVGSKRQTGVQKVGFLAKASWLACELQGMFLNQLQL